MQQSLLLMGGISLLLIGLSNFFRTKEWNDWLIAVEKKGKQASLMFGGVNVLFGSFIVAFHNVWHGIPAILTVIGVLALLKGAVYLLFPSWLPAKLKVIKKSEKPLIKASGLILALIGTLLLYSWYNSYGDFGFYLI